MGVALRAREEPITAELTLSEVFASIRRRKWIVLLAMIIGGAAAFAYVSTSTPVYTATAEVLVLPVLISPTRSVEPVSMATENRLVTSTAVTDLVLEALKTDDVNVLKQVSVDTVEGTEILAISYSDSNPETARLGAQSFATSYLQIKAQEAADSVARYAEPLEKEVADASAAIEALNRRISRLHPGSPRWISALDQRSELEATRLSLLDQLAPITTMSTDPGEVVRSAEIPSTPSSPKWQMSLVLGVVLGLLVGVGVAYAWGPKESRRTENSTER